MNDIEITREFLDENAEEVKSWPHAAKVIFSAWVAPELADKAELRVLRRAEKWLRTHGNAIIRKEERIEAYSGEIIVAATVYKVSVNR